MHREGQEFFYYRMGTKPDKFCSWAWDDISRFVFAIEHGATFKSYLKKDGQPIACCADGVRPVVFNIEKI